MCIMYLPETSKSRGYIEGETLSLRQYSNEHKLLELPSETYNDNSMTMVTIVIHIYLCNKLMIGS